MKNYTIKLKKNIARTLQNERTNNFTLNQNKLLKRLVVLLRI